MSEEYKKLRDIESEKCVEAYFNADIIYGHSPQCPDGSFKAGAGWATAYWKQKAEEILVSSLKRAEKIYLAQELGYEIVQVRKTIEQWREEMGE